MSPPEIPLVWREILLGVALGLVTVLAFLFYGDRADRIRTQRRQICAMERYFINRYNIDLAVPGIPVGVFQARLVAIERMIHEADTNCSLPQVRPPK